MTTKPESKQPDAVERTNWRELAQKRLGIIGGLEGLVSHHGAQVTALRTALEALIVEIEDVKAQQVRPDKSTDLAIANARTALSANPPPTVPDTEEYILRWSFAALENLRKLIGPELPIGMIANARWAKAKLPEIRRVISTVLDHTPGGAALVFPPDTTAIVRREDK